MSNRKFTPGPWKVGLHYNEIIDVDSVGWSGMIQASENDSLFPNQGKANANLIAAAPELFEALQKMIERLEDRSEYDKCVQLYYEARKAIKKALGE